VIRCSSIAPNRTTTARSRRAPRSPPRPCALALAETYLVQRLTGATEGNAWANSGLLSALDLYLHAQILVVTEGAGRDLLLSAARRTYAPTLCIAGPWAASSILDGKTPAGEAARAFVCTGPTCSPPVTDPAALTVLLRDPD
jgi:uncharacterized protein YyaL (SSP411 family)